MSRRPYYGKISHFDRRKIERFIQTYGTEFVFERPIKNDYGEPTEEKDEIFVVGVFHQTSGYVTKTLSDGTIKRTKPQPQILVPGELNELSKRVRIGDQLEYCSKHFEVVDMVDFNNLGIACDISLELVDRGT